eukprot:2654015-Prymnesium_polylepis.1
MREWQSQAAYALAEAEEETDAALEEARGWDAAVAAERTWGAVADMEEALEGEVRPSPPSLGYAQRPP